MRSWSLRKELGNKNAVKESIMGGIVCIYSIQERKFVTKGNYDYCYFYTSVQ